MSFPLTPGDLDDAQFRILDQRLSDRGLGGVQGPPGTGKSLLMAHEAAIAYALGIRPIVVAAFGNHTIDHVMRYTLALLSMGTLTRIEGHPRDHICRVGYTQAISEDVLPFHTNSPREIRKRGLIFTTLHSAWRIASRIDAERIIIDETAQARPEQAYIVLENALNFASSRSGEVALTVVGDHMQARPISPDRHELGILSRLVRSRPDRVTMLTTTYREPEPNVDLTSGVFYEGRLDAPREVRNRRLPLASIPSGWHNVLDPEEPLTFLDTHARECQAGFGFSNPEQAHIVEELVRAYCDAGVDVRDNARFMVISPYRGQVIETRRRLEASGFPGVKVISVTKALGLEADITIFQTVRSNPSGNLGMTGWSEVLNVGTSRMRCKLIVVGDFETFAEGHVYDRTTGAAYFSRSRRMARFIESHGSLVAAQMTTP
jgi:hypothetical protein